MSKTIRLYDINWDTSDDDDIDGVSLRPSLPTNVTVIVDQHWNPDEEAADLLGDNYGYCVNGCRWEEIKG